MYNKYIRRSFFYIPPPLSSYLIMCSKDISLSQIFTSAILPENPFLDIHVQLDTHSFMYSLKHVHFLDFLNQYIPVAVQNMYISVHYKNTFLYICKTQFCTIQNTCTCLYNFNQLDKRISEKILLQFKKIRMIYTLEKKKLSGSG